MSQKIIAVVGATGMQGGGVVNELLARGRFAVRALTRNPDSDRAKALATRGCEVVAADLTKPETLAQAFAGAHGVFAVTNFWEQASVGETEQGRGAVAAAKTAAVQHYIWSTLPNCAEISAGKYKVHHFTGKALVDADVAGAGFAHHTFVEAPMYFQNLSTAMAPQAQQDGSKAWAFPMDPDKRCIHAGDPTQLGRLVARAFEQPERVAGKHLAQAGGIYSWQEMVDTLNAQGHNVRFQRISREQFDALPFPGAAELGEMMSYFEDYTYFGPAAERMIVPANELCADAGDFTEFADWAKANMKA